MKMRKSRYCCSPSIHICLSLLFVVVVVVLANVRFVFVFFTVYLPRFVWLHGSVIWIDVASAAWIAYEK